MAPYSIFLSGALPLQMKGDENKKDFNLKMNMKSKPC